MGKDIVVLDEERKVERKLERAVETIDVVAMVGNTLVSIGQSIGEIKRNKQETKDMMRANEQGFQFLSERESNIHKEVTRKQVQIEFVANSFLNEQLIAENPEVLSRFLDSIDNSLGEINNR